MIKVKDKLCKCGCGQTGRIWSRGMLKNCYLKLNPPKKIQYKSAKQKVKDVAKAERTKDLHEWFLTIWDGRRKSDERGFYVECFESGEKLYEQYYKHNTCCYHHLIEKSKYPEYEFDSQNLIIIHPDIHTLTHSNIDKTPKIKEKLNELRLQLF